MTSLVEPERERLLLGDLPQKSYVHGKSGYGSIKTPSPLTLVTNETNSPDCESRSSKPLLLSTRHHITIAPNSHGLGRRSGMPIKGSMAHHLSASAFNTLADAVVKQRVAAELVKYGARLTISHDLAR